ncbi:uncharacterized protein [Ptychodera flava]|uniref:uncharacterized protein n=1 Tax=Ptychodera flava TaxID=63121 RepID=UPI00396A3935
MGEDRESSRSTEAIVHKVVNVLYKTLQDVEQEHVIFARQRNYFINAIKHRIDSTSNVDDLSKNRVKLLGVKTLSEVRALLSPIWSSESEFSGSATTQGALEMFLDLTYQLRELRENLDVNLPDHIRQHCYNEMVEWERMLSNNYDFSHLDKEKYTLESDDRLGFSGLVSLLPSVFDTAYTVFQILGEYFGARKNTPYRPQLRSKDSNVIHEELDNDVFVTKRTVLEKDAENSRLTKSKTEIKSTNQMKTSSPRRERIVYSKRQTTKTPRRINHLSPRLVTKQPTISEFGKRPIVRLQSKLPGKLQVQLNSQQRQRQSKYTSMQGLTVPSSKQISPRATTPYQRLKKEETRFPTVDRFAPHQIGQRNKENVQISAVRSQLPYLRKLHGNDNVSPRHTKLSSPTLVSQSLPRSRGGKMTHSPLHSSFDPVQMPYPRMQHVHGTRQQRISTSSRDSIDAVPVSVVYHGSTIFNYPGQEVTSEMDYTTKAIKRIEERLLPQMDSMKSKVRKVNLRQKEDTNIISALEERLQKMEDEIEDIKTRQLLHNYYLGGVLRTVTVKDLDIIKDHVAYKDIIELGKKLGLSQIDVEDVKEETNKPREQVLQMLLSWRNKLGKIATLDLIVEALIAMKRRDTANNIIIDMKNRS